MLSETARDALYDIRDHAIHAQEFVAGMDLDTFTRDRKTFFAATRALEIVSEAARRLPEELRARHPDLPWRAIMGSGNIYRHNYDNVAHHAVWHTIHDELPALAAVVAEEIAKLS